MKTIVVAADSNLIGIAPKERLTDKTERLAHAVASLLEDAHNVVFCHGGSAQAQLIHSVMADGARAGIAPGSPTDACIAMSAGFLGFNLQEVISQHIDATGQNDALPTGAILTQVMPNGADLPQIIEMDAIRTLLKECRFLIAGGSGGIPVERSADGTFCGGDVLEDVHLTAAAIAHGADADTLLILLDDREELPEGPLSAQQAKSACSDSSLSTVVRSALSAASQFAAPGAGRRAVLAHISETHDALHEKSGLQIR